MDELNGQNKESLKDDNNPEENLNIEKEEPQDTRINTGQEDPIPSNIDKGTPKETSDFKINISLADTNKVFVICSDDVTMRTKIHEFLNQMKITPVFTHQKQGDFKPMAQIYNMNKNINFAIVLLSADNFSYPRVNGSPKDALMRSDQKVIFELGFCIGKFGRDRVIALYYDQKSYRCPTEIFDALYIPFDKKNVWQGEVKEKLKNAGYVLES